MVTAITTSTFVTATASFNGRKVDRCQDGTLLALLETQTNNGAGNAFLRYSKDNGATWTAVSTPGGVATGVSSGTLFVDLDDYVHVVWRQVGTTGPNGSSSLSSGVTYYMRGTPNAGRTAWTWSAATVVGGNAFYNYPDMVACRDPATGGWNAFIVLSYSNTSSNLSGPTYSRIAISSAGVVSTTPVIDNLSASGTGVTGGLTNTFYGTTVDTYPTIDFNHTGDGKTVAGGTPHLYTAWNSRSTGVNNGVRFRKAVYSAGTWSWNAEREIDNTLGSTANGYWQQGAFDGTRYLIAGFSFYSGSGERLYLLERDAADTANTTRVSAAQSTADLLLHGSLTYDSAGNVYLLGRDNTGGAGTHKINRRRWVRSTATLEAVVTVGTVGSDAPYVSARRGYANAGGQSVDYIWTDGSASPYTVEFDRLIISSPPNAPTLIAPTNASTSALAPGYTFQWTFSDPDTTDTQTSYAFRRKISGAGAYEYWNATSGAFQSTEVFNASTVGSVTFPAGVWTNGNVYQWSVATRDNSTLTGPYASDYTVTAGTAPVVAVTAPTGTYTIGTRPTVTWSYSDAENDPQQSYQVKVFNTTQFSAGGFDPSSSTAEFTGPVVNSTTDRAYTLTQDLNVGVPYRAYVQVSQVNGQTSIWMFAAFTVSLDLPAPPALTGVFDTTLNRSVLTVRGLDNLFSANRASFETDVSEWGVGVNATLARSSTQFVNGSYSMSVAAVAAGDASASSGASISRPAASPGATYRFYVAVRAATTVRSVRLDARFWNAAQSAVTSQVIGTPTADINSGWTVLSTTATADANGVFADLLVTFIGCAAGEVHYIDTAGVFPFVAGITAWSRGGLVGTTAALVEASDDGGLTWSAVRGSTSVILAAPLQQATVYDREATPKTTRQYRARTLATV